MRGKELLILSEIAQENLKKDSYSSKLKRGKTIHTRKGALQFVKENGNNIKSLPLRLKNNTAVVLASIENNPSSFKYAGTKARNKFGIARLAVEKEPENIEKIGYELKINKEKFRELAKLALSKNGMLLKNLPEFQNDDEMVNIAVTNNSLSLEFANKRFKKDHEFIYNHAIERSFTLLNADKELLKNKNFIKKIVSENPVALHSLPMYQNDIDIVETAILAMPNSLRFASFECRNNKIIKDFVNKHNLKEAEPYLLNDEKLEKVSKFKKIQRKYHGDDEIEAI